MKLFSWLHDEDPEAETGEPKEPLPLTPALDSRLSELGSMPVTDAMIPRSVVKALDVDVQLRRVRRLKSSKTLYFPVYKGDLDHVLGWIDKAKVLELMNETSEEIHLTQHLRPVGTVSESAKVADLADAFLKSASPFLVVKNAQGATSGIVPLSEFVELLFGFELAPPDITPSSDSTAPPLQSYEV